MVNYISVAPERYRQFQQATAEELNELHVLINKGWPDTKEEVPHAVRPYWSDRDTLAVYGGVIYKGQREYCRTIINAKQDAHQNTCLAHGHREMQTESAQHY